MEVAKRKLYNEEMKLPLKALTFLTCCSTLMACAQSDKESTGPVFCTIDQSEVYQLNTDPTTNFNVTNLSKTISFNDTDCPNINNDSFTSFVSRVKRVDNGLQIYERQYQSSQFLLEMDISGTTLLPVRQVLNSNNCSIIRTWQGNLDAAAETVNINLVIEYKGACQSTFYNPDTDTTSPAG